MRERELRNRLIPDTEPDYPFYLLGEDGWSALDPFLPVKVPAFSDGEVDTMIDYYVAKRFIREEAATDSGRKEVRFLTAGSPKDFMKFSAMW